MESALEKINRLQAEVNGLREEISDRDRTIDDLRTKADNALRDTARLEVKLSGYMQAPVEPSPVVSPHSAGVFPKPEAKRPNIGQPGFEWAVGMVFERRNGLRGEIQKVRPFLQCTFGRKYWQTGRYLKARETECDLIRVIRWPDGFVYSEESGT